MIVKVAPLGEVVVEVNVEEGTSIKAILETADVEENGRSIRLNNSEASLSTTLHRLENGQTNIITLASQMKGGC